MATAALVLGVSAPILLPILLFLGAATGLGVGAALLVAAVPALLGLGFGVAALSPRRRERARVWPMATAGVVLTGLLLVVLIVLAVQHARVTQYLGG